MVLGPFCLITFIYLSRPTYDSPYCHNYPPGADKLLNKRDTEAAGELGQSRVG